MAGNGNSGNVIAFRLSEAQLERKIKEFREEYGEGQHGIVTWPMFCDFLGYSELEVAECYQKGKEGKNAYSGRARLLEAFRTAVKGMTASHGYASCVWVGWRKRPVYAGCSCIWADG